MLAIHGARPVAFVSPGVAILCYAFLLRLDVQGTPSLVCPRGETVIHCMAASLRLPHGRALVAPIPPLSRRALRTPTDAPSSGETYGLALCEYRPKDSER